MLKSKTHDQHEAAEKHPFHVVLFGGEGPQRAREAYVRSLGQHLAIQETFEPLLRKAAAQSYTFRAMVKPYHYHLDALRDDLAALGATSEHTRVLPATARFISFIEACAAHDGCALLGVWYVFEGSTNGGTIIGKRLKDMLGLPDERGTRFTNPHGPQVRARWGEWKQTLDALEFDAPHQLAIIDAARQTFNAIGAMMSDVHAAMSAEREQAPEVVVKTGRREPEASVRP